MKKITIGAIAISLSAITAAFCLTACGNSDKSSSTETTAAATTAAVETTAAPATTEAAKSALIGTWDSVEAPGTYYTFNEDGTGVIGGEGYTIKMNYVDKGASVELTSEGNTSALVWNYTIEGDKLSMTDADGATLTYTKGEAKSTEGTVSATENGSALVGTWVSDKEEDGSFTFNADGTGIIKTGAYEESFTYVDNGSSVEIKFANADAQSSTYTIEGDKLTMTDAANVSTTYTKQ